MNRIRIIATATVLAVAGCAKAPAAVITRVPHDLITLPVDVAAPAFFRETFDGPLEEQQWREVEVNGRGEYTVQRSSDGNRWLQALSQSTASILLCPVTFHPDAYEWLSWRWKVDRPVPAENLYTKQGSDAAARVYVYFETKSRLPWAKRNLDYVWSAHLPVGTVLSSPYAASSKIIVVNSGNEHLGQWRTVVRNLEDDYHRCFDGPLPRVVGIGLMTDSDNTNSESAAAFDDVIISHQVPRDPDGAGS